MTDETQRKLDALLANAHREGYEEGKRDGMFEAIARTAWWMRKNGFRAEQVLALQRHLHAEPTFPELDEIERELLGKGGHEA